MTQQGRNMYECVMIDDKTLFAHLLVISVFALHPCFSALIIYGKGKALALIN
jgi:hypothetical protein